MKKNDTSVPELFFKFIIRNFKKAILIFVLPQLIYFAYEKTIKNENCTASTKIIVSKAVTNTKIVKEIFIENLNLENETGINIYSLNIKIEGLNEKDCQEKYNLLLSETARANTSIEEFYFNELTESEQSRFAGPMLFNTIGGRKIQFAKLGPLDTESLKNKETTRNRIYIMITSFIGLMMFFIFKTFKNF